ncbi:MAG TPA: Rnf-Nqr domain containing protein [Clostridia bacterium]
MTLLQLYSTSLPMLFLLASFGGFAPIYTLPGLFPEAATGQPGIVRHLLAGVTAVLFSLPAHLILQALRLILPGTLWLAVLGPILLAVLFGGLIFLLRLAFGRRLFGDAGWTGHARMLIASAGLALFPALDPSLSILGFLPATVFVLGSGLGYTLLLILLGIIRERLEMAGIPPFIRGTPAILITAGLIGLAGLGLVSLLS